MMQSAPSTSRVTILTCKLYILIASDDVSESLNEKKAVPTKKRISFNLIILLTGGTITLVLLVLIFHTIWRHQSLVSLNCNDVEAQPIHETEPVYYELNRGMS